MAAAAAIAAPPGARIAWGLTAPLGLVYLVFFAAPFAILLGISFYADSEQTRIGLDSWTKFYGDAFYLKVIFDTLKLGVFAVVATTFLAYPLALVFRVASPRVQRVMIFVILMPLLTSVVIRTFAWIVILAREGVVNQALVGAWIRTSAPLEPAPDGTRARDRADADRDAADAAAAASPIMSRMDAEPRRRLPGSRRLAMAHILPRRSCR